MDDGGKFLLNVAAVFLMKPVAIGGFDDEIVGIGNVLRVADDALVFVSDVAAENYFFGDIFFGQPQLDACRTEKMTYIGKSEFYPLGRAYPLAVAAPVKQGKRAQSVVYAVHRLDRVEAGALGLS